MLVKSMLETMIPLLKRSGISEISLNKLLDKIDEEKHLTKLKEVYIHEFRDTNEIYNLLPKEKWDMYLLLEVKDLREQLLLDRALLALRKAFYLRFARGHKKKKT